MKQQSAEGGEITGARPRTGGKRGRPTKLEATGTVDRRTQILTAATRRFARVGFLGTTVRQIADDVNILSGSLYHHFTNKEDMLDEIVRDTVARMEQVACEIAARPVGAEERFVAMIRANLAEMKDHLETHAILFREREFFRNRDEFAYVVKAKKAGYLAWESILADGIREGMFRADLDIFLTISTIVRTLNSAADWFSDELGAALDSTPAYSVTNLADFFDDFMLHAIRRVDRVSAPIPGPGDSPVG